MAIFDLPNSDLGKKLSGAAESIKNVFTGINRTDKSYSPIGLVAKDGTRYQPGFTPNSFYDNTPLERTNKKGGVTSDSWYGHLLDVHPLSTSDVKMTDLSTIDRFERSKNLGDKSFTGPYSTRDYQIIFGDTSMDYFRYGLHVLNGANQFRTESGGVAWNGNEQSIRSEVNTPYENTDPVFFGFEIVIDAVSSPLLNGSVDDFIEQFQNNSAEISSRRNVLKDFKIQFSKLFKTRGTIKMAPVSDNEQRTMAYNTPNYATQPSQSQGIFEGGRKAYMSYYVKKIEGLENLIISNTSNKKKYLTDYRNDVLKITLHEDVSLTLSTLSHLYRLLYWSKPNGKNIIPENLLRFNCDIIISECRNFNRVRRAQDTGDIEVIKENLSRHIYQLRECQFHFDSLTHDQEIDLEQIKDFPGAKITMDYKYVTTKFERWTPDGAGFGQYVGYNSGALWKRGNKGFDKLKADSSIAGTLQDVSVPKFYTLGTNQFNANGVGTPIVFDSFAKSTLKDEPLNQDKISQQEGIDRDGRQSSQNERNETGEPEDGEGREKADKKARRRQKRKESFEAFKEASKQAGRKLKKDLQRAIVKEVVTQVNIRLRLLNDTLEKIRNSTGIGQMRAPTNVYPSHPPHPGIEKEPNLPNYSNSIFGFEVPGIPGNPGSSLFFDVQNSVRDFAGDSLGALLGNRAGNILRGGNAFGR